MSQAPILIDETSDAADPWCSWATGAGRILVIAPHGGDRNHPATAEIPRRGAKRQRINDLHTADLALQLAEKLNASYVVNHGLDRNRLDLNRISQVRRRAPWFLRIISDLATSIVRRHGEVHVLFIHGWNVNQGRCDLGIGAPVPDPDAPPAGLTVSRSFLGRYLAPLADGAHDGLLFTLGQRYPARHRNNLLQLFRVDGSRCDELRADLADEVRAGRCQAVQLEIGIPLRWPGPRREAFVSHLTRVFSPWTESPRPPRRKPVTVAPPPATGASAIQVFDPRSGIALLASVDAFPPTTEPITPRTFFGRVALFLPDGRVALYTGESETATQLASDGPCFTTDEATLGLTFGGSFLITANGDDYVDLERAFSRSDIAAAEITLRHTAEVGRRYGSTTGTVSLGGESFSIDAIGFSAAREWGAWRRAARAHWSVRAAFNDGSATILRSAQSPRGASAVDCSRILMAADPYTPEEITIEAGPRIVRVRPLVRMSIARPVGPRRRARVTFGPAVIRGSDGAEAGFGIFEYARLIDL